MKTVAGKGVQDIILPTTELCDIKGYVYKVLGMKTITLKFDADFYKQCNGQGIRWKSSLPTAVTTKLLHRHSYSSNLLKRRKLT
jgi:hypothetical protein